MKYLFILFILTGCAPTTYNLIDLTDEQWIEDPHGTRCLEKQMIITPDAITYLYENCPIRRVVKPKPHILPKPTSPKNCKLSGLC